MPTIHLTIKGKVQGVFYRASAKEAAEMFQVKGWVKNTFTGDVEIMASGDETSLKDFIAWCRTGPGRAIVSDVIILQQEEIFFDEFIVLK